MRKRPFSGFMLYMLPALVVIAVVAVYPLLRTFLLSMQDCYIKTPWLNRGFVGLNNYVNLYADSRFFNALNNTLLFVTVSVVLEFLIGLIIALCLHRLELGRRSFVRAAILVPWIVPTVVSAQIWRWMLHDKFGVINYLLVRLGITADGVAWFANPGTAFAAIIAIDVWKTTPFMVLLLFTGLQAIPGNLYDAARVDGASWWQTVRRITIPLLAPAILVALIFRTVDAIRIFDLVYVLTKGGPGNATEMLSLYAYKKMFASLDFGYGSSISVTIFLLAGLCAIAYILCLRRARGALR
jgi:ABC-type sugar transport system permease subunit